MAVTTAPSSNRKPVADPNSGRTLRKVLRLLPTYLLMVFISALIILPLLWMK